MMKLETEDLLEETFVADTTCPACYAEFLDAEDLDIHVRQMHLPVPNSLHCQFCAATCSDALDYAAHVRDAHLFDLRSCRYCAKVFSNGGNLKMHQQKHTVDKSLYTCSQCNSVFSEPVSLERHEHRTHDNDKDGVVLKCMPLLSSILNLKAVTLLQSIGKKVLTCSACSFTSVNLESYINHLKVKKCKGFVCDRCSGVYKGKMYLLKHLRFNKKCKSVNEYSDEVVTCTDCNKAVHPKAMKLHKKKCSTLKCVDCSIVCRTIDELSEHQTKEHPSGMNFIRCKFCSKEVIGETTLKKHVNRVHRPYFHLYKYQCRDCKAIFKHPQKLFAHFFTTHKELKPFNCKICNKSFRVRKSFSLHIKLDHKSVGYVEFDDQYHVFFSDNKSEKPFVPECVLPAEDLYESESEDTSKQGKDIPADSQISDTDATNAGTEDDEKTIKRKRSPKQIKSKRQKKNKNEPVLIYSSDEEPLLELRKRSLKRKTKRRGQWKKNLATRSQFMCEICDKNCYTYQNHQNHMNTHNKNQELECVKCSKRFNRVNDLTRHMKKEHATSKLTETLKDILRKKKHNSADDSNSPQMLEKSDKFTIIMKKAKIDKSETAATIKPVETDLSVKNFIENFTPEITDASPKEMVHIDSTVTIKAYKSLFYREPTIKLIKFNDEPAYEAVPLKMPQRFKRYDYYEKTKINIKLVDKLIESPNKFFIPETDHNYSDTLQERFNDVDHIDDDGNGDEDNDIPEMAHEVSLGTEEPVKPTLPPTRIVIPKMPKGYSKIHIATLQPEAPFFKIIKVDSDKLRDIKKKEDPPMSLNTTEVINLPGGTKLVTANPLAHLLGQGSLESKKSYKSAVKDFQGILAQAMQKLEEAPTPKKRKARISKMREEPNEGSKV